jgi:uncharacterized protein (DUF433 family)
MSSSPVPIREKAHVVSTPGVCGGKPCIAGTRIRVQDVYAWHELQGRSPGEIVSAFPQLTLADVYAALAHFWDHRDEILAQMKQQDDAAEQSRGMFPSKLPDRGDRKG